MESPGKVAGKLLNLSLAQDVGGACLIDNVGPLIRIFGNEPMRATFAVVDGRNCEMHVRSSSAVRTIRNPTFMRCAKS